MIQNKNKIGPIERQIMAECDAVDERLDKERYLMKHSSISKELSENNWHLTNESELLREKFESMENDFEF